MNFKWDLKKEIDSKRKQESALAILEREAKNLLLDLKL